MPTLDWQERLTVLDRDYHFVPTTKQEQNVAFGAIPFLNEPGSVGRHLNEILIHQDKHSVAYPDRAVRALTRDMGTYRADAIRRRSGLLELHHQLREVNPRLEVGQIDELDLTGLLSTMQYVHIVNGMRTGNDRPLEGGIKSLPGQRKRQLMTRYDPETNDRTTTEMAMGDLVRESVMSLRGMVIMAGKSHKNRREFWKGMLENSRSHAAARPIVEEILAA